MLDMIGAITITAVYAAVVGAFVGSAQMRRSAMVVILGAAALWGILVVVIAASGGFAPGTTGSIPAVGLAFAAWVALLFGSWFFSPQFRSALLSVPLPVLVALNIARIGGVFFLILAADARLTAPFAPSAGWGDIITGVLAIPLTLAAIRGPERASTGLRLWNAFGTLDLVVAIALGLLSAPGTPFQTFTEEPGTLAIGTLPWIMIPAMLVPIYLLVHLTIAVKLRLLRRTSAPVATAS